jgi:hypothetical protein
MTYIIKLLFTQLPAGQWTQVCVTFENGVYNVYVDGVNALGGPAPAVAASSFPQNTHSPAILGFKEGFGAFSGYLDDVSACHTLSKNVRLSYE